MLDIEYLPKLMPYREEQQKYLARCISRLPAIGTNVMIHGPPGIGKTACVRWVFRELTESESEVMPVYINCWKDTDLQKIVFTLCSQFGINTAYRNQNELLNMVFGRMKSQKAVVIAFDEIDRTHDQTFLYHFMEEIPHKSIFMISTKNDWLSHLDSRVRSRLMPEIMGMKHYTLEQIRGILKERREYAFAQGSWEPEAFEMVVSRSFAEGDIRTGLALLKSGGLEAERDASRKVRVSHVNAALEKMGMQKIDEPKRLSYFG